MAQVRRSLQLGKRWLFIYSPIPFYIVTKPTGYMRGEDVIRKPAGNWKIDCVGLISQLQNVFTLDNAGRLTLMRGLNADNPIYNLELQYDDSELLVGQIVEVNASNVDLDSVAGVAGELVTVANVKDIGGTSGALGDGVVLTTGDRYWFSSGVKIDDPVLGEFVLMRGVVDFPYVWGEIIMPEITIMGKVELSQGAKIYE